MSANIKSTYAFTKHPQYEGVFVKHLFDSGDNDRLNNLEVQIVPGFEISPHTHENSTEFFYCVCGKGEFLDGEKWEPIQAGDALKAPLGHTHGIRNTGRSALKLFSTFSPATR